SALVVARHLFHAKRRALAELRRHDDGRELRRERVREVNHFDVAGGDRAGEGEQIGRCPGGAPTQAPSSRSSALGLTASRARMSSATSPTKTSSRPCCRARTVARASADGATLGGGTAWYHSVSSGPEKTFTTFTPPGRSSARSDCAA